MSLHKVYFGLLDDWKIQNQHCLQIIQKIGNALKSIEYAKGNHWGELSDCTLLHQQVADKLHQKAMQGKAELQDQFDKMIEIYGQLIAIEFDEKSRGNMEEITTMYGNELMAKAIMVTDMAQGDILLYLSTWQLEPYIDTSRIACIQQTLL